MKDKEQKAIKSEVGTKLETYGETEKPSKQTIVDEGITYTEE